MWTIHNDRQSVTVGINKRIQLCLARGLSPSQIQLGPDHSRLFWKEHGLDYIPTRGANLDLAIRDLSWDEKSRTWKYSSRLIPMAFNVPGLYGIATVGN